MSIRLPLSVLTAALAFLLQFLLQAPPAPAQQAPPTALQADLHSKLEAEMNHAADRLNGVLGYAVKDLATGESFYHNADLVFPTAS